VSDGPSHFKRFNALADLGYIGSLPAMELRVLLIFERHADANGETWPGPDTIAKKLSILERNVRRAIASLVRRGMLTGGAPGLGRGNILKRRITIPENRAQCARLKPQKNPAQDGQKTGRSGTRKPGATTQKNRAQCARGTSHESPNEQPNNNHSGGDAALGGGRHGEFLLSWVGKKAAQAALERHGIEHCERVAQLVVVMHKNGNVKTPKRLFRHFIDLEPVEVDFKPLDDSIAAEAQKQRSREYQEEERREEEEQQLKVEEMKQLFASIPKEDREFWKRLFNHRHPDSAGYDPKKNFGVMCQWAEMIRTTPDVRGALLQVGIDVVRIRARGRAPMERIRQGQV
jgi:hypothetical protein